jgi:hypothetical protein
LDTIVTDKEISDYYVANKNEFLLQTDIIRVLYIKLNVNSDLSNEGIKLINSDNFDKTKTEQFCKKYAVNYFIDTKYWLYISDIIKEIPLNQMQTEKIRTGDTFMSIKDEEYIYLLKVIDAKLKGSISPLAFEENTIKEIILQKRKKQIINNRINELKTKNQNKGKIKIFI